MELEKLRSSVLDTQLLANSSNSIKRRDYLDTVLTKELLEELFYVHNFTANYIALNILTPLGLKITAASIIDRCKKLNIKTLTIKESCSNLISQKQKKETCIKKYGQINPLSKGTDSYLKRNKTVKDKYGVDNVFQLEDIKTKSKETFFRKYGVASTVHLPNYKYNNGRVSKVHQKVNNYLDSVDVDYEYEKSGSFCKFNSYLNREYSPIVDIYISSRKIVVEIFGDYWHGNPKIYKATDIIGKWRGDVLVKDVWDFDKSRIQQIESFGYKVIVLWEYDVNKNFEQVKLILNGVCKN